MANEVDNESRILKHLEMIQNAITRMATNSFLIKGWAFILITIASAFAINSDTKEGLVLVLGALLVPLWLLDAYFLSLERKYRELYGSISKSEATDMSMAPPKETAAYSNMWHSFFSKTLVPFYVTLVVAFVAVYLLSGGN